MELKVGRPPSFSIEKKIAGAFVDIMKGFNAVLEITVIRHSVISILEEIKRDCPMHINDVFSLYVYRYLIYIGIHI